MTDSRCFSGILRRLLCSDGLRTHPSDHTTEFQYPGEDYAKPNKIQAPPATPGIVARLMGLESLPDSNRIPKSHPDSFTRSRSVNFMDYLPEFDLAQTKHRRVRTSVSFREVPAFSGLPKQELFVFHLDNNNETDNMPTKKQRKLEMRIQQNKDENTSKKISKARTSNQVSRRKQSSNPNVKIRKEAVDELESTKKKRTKRSVNKRINQERYSSKPLSANTRHKPEKRTIERRVGDVGRPEPESTVKLVKTLISLTEKDVGEQKWILNDVFKSEDFEEICTEFGSNVFDRMLQQIIDELHAVEIF